MLKNLRNGINSNRIKKKKKSFSSRIQIGQPKK